MAVTKFPCSNCEKEYLYPRYTCPSCRVDLCFRCATSFKGECPVCGVKLEVGKL